MKNKIIEFFKTNYIPFVFAACAVIIELTAVAVTAGKFYIRNPLMYLTMLAVLTGIQFFIGTNKARYVYSSVALAAIFVCDLVFIVIYEMTGTIFDFSMLKLRSDAMRIIEKLKINFWYVTVGGVLVSAFIVFARFPMKYVGNPVGVALARKVVIPIVLCAAVIGQSLIVYTDVREAKNDPLLKSKLYGKAESVYSDRGVLGNFASEIYKGVFKRTDPGKYEDVADFIYRDVTQPSPMFGAAEGYNVVTVLAESFEWFSFIADAERFPNGHTADEQTLRELYPNLYKLYDTSYAMTNFHGREKTDISENLSLIGNYPLDYYLNYDYSENNIAYSVPNVLKTLYGVESESFHNGTKTFYNRDQYLTDAVGFKEFIATEDMEGDVMTNYIELGERNLDSEMIAAMKERMFPTDRRFNTYITTITTHGQYSHRDNLQKYYDIIDERELLPPPSDGRDHESLAANAFYYYCAAAMELDAALGAIMDYLDETGLADNTLLVVFGDHNTYYQSLSPYVKNLYEANKDEVRPFTDLFCVPMFVRVGSGLDEGVKVDKFTCTADIVPTILDLLGIRQYANLCYGTSAFHPEESILYSRAYGVFITDKMYFTTLQNIKYQDPAVTDAYYKGVEDRALKLLEKISYTNRMFAGDFFRDERLATYNARLKALNGIS